MTNKDFSKFRSYNDIPCEEDEFLYPVVLTVGMRSQLADDGLVSRNVVKFSFPGAGKRVPVAFIRIREDQRKATEQYFNLQVHLYLSGDTLFDGELLSLDQMMEHDDEDDSDGYDPTGSMDQMEETNVRLALDEVGEKLSRLDPLYGRIFSLLREEYSQKEILERIDWTKGKSQGYALIAKVRRLARELYEE